MKGSIAVATEGAEGFDADTPLSADACAELVAAGMQFAIRFVGLSGRPAAETDLTAAEVNVILTAGLALMVAQPARLERWTPSAKLGAADGRIAVLRAASAGVPAGTCLWCDLEGGAGSAQETIEHANAWTDQVRTSAYDPGVCVGERVPLTGKQWHKELTARRYWRSLGNVPDVPVRGFQMVQRAGGPPVAGVRLDRNRIQADGKGDLPIWCAPRLLVASA